MQTLIVIVGPPAVGKMAVGRELERRTGIPLLHNHMTIDLVLPFFEYGSEPFSRLVDGFRQSIIDEVASSNSRGLIFTFVWAFERPGDDAFVERLMEPFQSRGGRIVFVELFAPLEVRLERNETPLRLLEKPSKRDVEASRARLLDIDTRHRMNSDGDFPYADHLFLDTTDISANESASLAIEYFFLPVLDTDTMGDTA